MHKIFSIYRSSAGSGKTRTLAREYLKLALRFRSDYFKHILAVTFTNKATQEMKDRILAYLDDFANGRPNELADDLKRDLNLDDQTFRERCQEAQSSILHNYSQFSISTIDAFFQRVIRSFTREAGLMGDYRLEIDQDAVLEEVVDSLIDELGDDKELTDWVVEFAKDNLENERAWDVRLSLMEFAHEIFREEFKAIEAEVNNVTGDRTFFKEFRSTLWQIRNHFFSKTSRPAAEAMQIISQQPWGITDIAYGKNSGLFTFFEKYATGKDIHKPTDRLLSFTDPDNWPSNKTRHASAIKKLAAEKLVPLLTEIIDTYDALHIKVQTAEVVLKNMYVFGLIADMARKLKEYKDENNMMLLADAPKFLNGVIQDSDTPFIYEKVGSYYRNYLIDEFQDTSGMQWKNFLPLLTNSLDQGYPSLVVGDVKQAIYRWRGGDLSLLQEQVGQHIGHHRLEEKELSSNYRSAAQVVNFNNALFRKASSWVALATDAPISVQAYKDVEQKISKADSGFVQIEFLTEESKGDKWKSKALDRIPLWLEQLQDAGVSLSDIAILVRTNNEGQEIVTHLLQYRNSPSARSDCRYDVISNESLRIDGAASVNLLLAAMRYLLNPSDAIARAQLSFEYVKLSNVDRELTEVFAVSNQVFFESNLPAAFTKAKALLKKLPLFEMTETLIEIFELGKQEGELTYIQTFQDLVLEFYAREKNDLGAFLEWWEENKAKKSIQVSGEVNAAQIMTIHKSKGLQFRYVLIPFCAWGLDHEAWKAPNLWVRTDQAPFADAGYVPVKYSSTLERTYFSAYYQEEHTRTYLDNLNLLYVALTRAEQGLIVMAPHFSVRGVKKTSAQVLYESMVQADELADGWKIQDETWSSGAIQAPVIKQKESTNILTLQTYMASRWRDRLVIRQDAKGYFDSQPEEVKEKIRYGIHLHAILSRIRLADDIEPALDRMIFDGLITTEERSILKDEFNELMADEQVASWFTNEWTIRTEVPILLPDGPESRIDRLLTRGKQAVVVDFKTGEPARADQRQVQEYMSILRQMNFTEVEGYLLYIRTRDVVAVKTGKPKALKRKDEHQLGLGF